MNFNENYTTESVIVFHENEWVVETKQIHQKFNPIEHKWFNTDVKTVYEGLETWKPNGLHEQLKTKILIKREAIDSYSLLPISAYFVIDVTVNADSRNPNERISICNGMFFAHDLLHGVTQPLGFRKDEPRLTFGKEKRLTDAEALKLIKSGTVTMSEHGKNGLIKELN